MLPDENKLLTILKKEYPENQILPLNGYSKFLIKYGHLTGCCVEITETNKNEMMELKNQLSLFEFKKYKKVFYDQKMYKIKEFKKYDQKTFNKIDKEVYGCIISTICEIPSENKEQLEDNYYYNYKFQKDILFSNLCEKLWNCELKEEEIIDTMEYLLPEIYESENLKDKLIKLKKETEQLLKNSTKKNNIWLSNKLILDIVNYIYDLIFNSEYFDITQKDFKEYEVILSYGLGRD